MQKLNTEKIAQKERISNLLLFLLLAVVGALLVLRVVVANRTVGVSEKLHTLDRQISQIESDNNVLSENLRGQQSLLVLKQRAVSAGFVSTKDYNYLAQQEQVAYQLNQDNP